MAEKYLFFYITTIPYYCFKYFGINANVVMSVNQITNSAREGNRFLSATSGIQKNEPILKMK